ncbi:hypothetical protein [Lysobacter humi (ex Lee et al. 2017)]
MARWWSNSATDTRLRSGVLALALLATFLLAACDRERAAGTPGAAGDDSGTPGALPAPAGTPGTSVTGMPTTPPAPVATAPEVPAEVAPVDPALAGTDPAAAANEPDALPVPVDPGVGAPGEPAPEGTPADAAGASRAMVEYMAALSSGAFARAQQQWAATPTDGAILDAARNPAFAVDVGAATLDASGRATVAAQVRGVGGDGTARSIDAVYILQRGTGSAWRIVGATLRDGPP